MSVRCEECVACWAWEACLGCVVCVGYDRCENVRCVSVRLECAVCMSGCIGCECEMCVRCEVCWVYMGCAFMGVCVRCLMCGYE